MTSNTKQVHDTFGDFFSNVAALAERDAKIVLPFDDTDIAAFISDHADKCRNPQELSTFAAMLFYAGMRLRAMSELQNYHKAAPQIKMPVLVAFALLHPELRNTLHACAHAAVEVSLHDAAQKAHNAL